MSQERTPHPRYEAGAAVVVADRIENGHVRTPLYLRGRHGVVVTVLGTFRDPGRLAFHKPGLPALPLYKVRFSQVDLWPDYTGGTTDTLEADIYESWLAPAEFAHA
jgi:nitrile hydratase subunit beta